MGSYISKEDLEGLEKGICKRNIIKRSARELYMKEPNHGRDPQISQSCKTTTYFERLRS